MNPKRYPSVSIALASYNGAQFICEQLGSYLTQTYAPCELVVTDDGSNDQTVAEIEAFASTAGFPVHIHHNDRNLGFRENFLKAASLCSGDLIAFSDQDDVWHPEKLERCAREFLDPEVLLCVHNGDVVDEQLRSTGRLVCDNQRRVVYRRMSLDFNYHAQGMRMVCSRWLLQTFDWRLRPTIFSTDQPRQVMDHDFWVIYLARVFGKIVVLPDLLISYRQHARNVWGMRGEPTTPVRERELIRLASGPIYREWAALAAIQRDFLAQLAIRHPKKIAIMLLESSQCYGHLQQALSLRADLHTAETKITMRVRRFARLILHGAYRTKGRGGLGWKAFLKDASRAFGTATFGCQTGGSAASSG